MVAALLLSHLKRRKWLWSVVVIGVLFGALPDLIGAHGNYVAQDRWEQYTRAHRGDVANILQYVPMYGLHLYLDEVTHGIGIRWWVLHERLWLEILLWILNVAAIAWLIKRWRQS